MAIWKTKYGWRAKFMNQGEWIYAQGTFSRKDNAREWVKQGKASLRTVSEPIISHALFDLIQAHLDDVQARFSHNTYIEKRTCLERLYRAVGDVLVTDVTPAQILALRNERAKIVSGNAANRDRKNIKAFFHWCAEVYGLTHDPTGPVRKLSHQTAPRRLLPIKDVLAVLMAAPMPERALVGAYWHTGARRGEILRWTWAEDVNLEARWIRLGTKKNRDGSMSYERLWMNEDLHTLLADVWRRHRDPVSPLVWPKYCVINDRGENKTGEQRAHRLLKHLCGQAGVEPFGFHDIRHTVATYLNDLGKVGMKKVQRVLRHRRQTTTEIYLQGDYIDTRGALELLEWDAVEKVTQKLTQKGKQGVSRIG